MMRPEFVIIGQRDCTTGQVMLSSLRQVRDVIFGNRMSGPDHNPLYSAYDEMTVTVTARNGGLFQVTDSGYPQAWQRMFDLWVPPQMTDETKSQVLTHFTFNPPEPSPPVIYHHQWSSGYVDPDAKYQTVDPN